MLTDADQRVIAEMVAKAPPPSEWTPEQFSELQRLTGPLYKAALDRAIRDR